MRTPREVLCYAAGGLTMGAVWGLAMLLKDSMGVLGGLLLGFGIVTVMQVLTNVVMERIPE